MLKKLTLIATCLCLLPSAQALELQSNHGTWTSGVLMHDDGTPLYRAISSVERKTSLYVYFAIDLYNDCSTYNPNLLINFPNGVDGEGSLNLGAFQARVDRRDIVKGAWRSSANEMGDTTFFVSLYTSEENRLLREMKLGNTARIKIEFRDDDSEDLFFNFSLQGSAAAITRAKGLCSQKRGKSERQYFDEDIL